MTFKLFTNLKFPLHTPMPSGKANRQALIQAARSAKRVQSRRRTQTPKFQSDSDPLLVTKKMKGELPPFNDLGHVVVDKDRDTIYTYGGQPPNGETPSADFFSCDMKTLKWKNLTVSNATSHLITP